MDINKAISLCKNGHKEAFSVIVNELYGKAVRFAGKFTKNIPDAEDMVQEAFVQVWRNLNSLKKQESFKSWFFTILNNTCKKSSKVAYHTPLNEEIISKSAEVELEEVGSKSMVEEYMKQLTPIQRKVLILRELEGMSYSEIGNVLGIAEGTVKSRISSAREKMRTLMTEGDQI